MGLDSDNISDNIIIKVKPRSKSAKKKKDSTNDNIIKDNNNNSYNNVISDLTQF